MKTFRPLLLFTALLLIVGLACGLTGGGTPSQTEQPAQQPTKEEPAPTEAPATEAPATEAPATEAPVTEAPATEAPAEAQEFFREEFNPDADLSTWEYFTLGSGTDKDLVLEQKDDYLLFDLGDEDLYVYFMYTGFTYDNVSLTMSAENFGRNNNNVSLVCRMNEDGTQWYEFSVESGGLWYLYAVDGGYNTIANGGTNALKQGKEVNEYQLVCDGDDITMYVNGDEIKSVTDTHYGFSEGQVGINISSLNVLPITVHVDWIDISEP